MNRLRLILITVTFLLVACVQQNSLPLSDVNAEQRSAASSFGMIQDRTSSSPGEARFVEYCSMCHRNMGMGTVLLSRRVDPLVAELESRDNLTAEYIIQVARTGLNNMPAIGRGEVSDANLRLIADYLEQGSGQ